MKALPCSYHTFFFPFIWYENDKITQSKFSDILSDKHWFPRNNPNESASYPEFNSDYALYQYLTIPARSLVFPSSESDLARCFEFRYNGKQLSDHGLYTIEKTATRKTYNGETKETEVFTLRINNIRLKTYNTGVGVLIFELEYHGDKRIDGRESKKYFCIDDINKINEYGRRINLPYHGTEESPCVLTADRISISVGSEGDQKVFEEIFDGESRSLTRVMDPIKDIMSLDSEYTLTSNKKKRDAKTKTLYIFPALDDRMFVCCLARNDSLSAKFSKYSNGRYAYLSEDSSVPTDLYKYAFIEIDCTCQSKTMRKDILSKSVYDRWIDYGTIYAVTHHSLVALTGERAGLLDPVINPFLTIYVQLALIALVQRATILALSAKASSVAGGLHGKGTDKLNEIEELQKDYARSHSQILLFEATTQEQGVEIFEKLVEQLYIKENKEALDEQMNNLRDVANTGYDRNEQRESGNLNNILAFVSVIALVLAVLEVAPAFYSDEAFAPYRILGISPALLALGVGVVAGLCVFATTFSKVCAWFRKKFSIGKRKDS